MVITRLSVVNQYVMLIEAAIGDAFGRKYEWAPVVKSQVEKLQYKNTGHYSDDTQMSLAIAEAIVENDPWTPETIAQRFVDVYKRDIRGGYSTRTSTALNMSNSGKELIENINTLSENSGSAMRAFPIGILPINEVLEKSEIQARITHNTPLGIAAAKASALTTYYFSHKIDKKDNLPDFIQENVETPDGMNSWNIPHLGEVSLKGWQCVKAAITAIVKSNSIAELLVNCVMFTGDVDTVAIIALAAASFSPEIEQNIPKNLYNDLENGTYGRDYIIKLDKKLLEELRYRGTKFCDKY